MADEEKVTPDAFREQFGSKAEEFADVIQGKVKSNVKEKFRMTTADKFWIAAILVVVLGIKDHRQRHKIKDLKKVVELLNMENDFLHTFVSGLTDPKANKEELLRTLGTQFQFLSMVKDM